MRINGRGWSDSDRTVSPSPRHPEGGSPGRTARSPRFSDQYYDDHSQDEDEEQGKQWGMPHKGLQLCWRETGQQVWGRAANPAGFCGMHSGVLGEARGMGVLVAARGGARGHAL